MVNNLPIILLLFRTWAFMLLCMLTAATAQAHPGHEGHEDGDPFTWTFDHLAKNPWATLLCAATVLVVVWLAVRLVAAKQRQAKVAAAGSPVAGTLS
jgi:hydrogenase/urease accessory protein HupE